MIGGAAMEQTYLPGTIRDRIKDLMKFKKIHPIALIAISAFVGIVFKFEI